MTSAPALQTRLQPVSRRLGWVLLLVLTFSIGAIGAVAYRALRDDLRHETQRTLVVIAEQKRQQIEAALGNSRHDAELYFTGHPPITALIVEWLAGGQTDEPLLARIQKRMGEIARLQGWAGLAVLDTAGRPAFTLGEAGTSELGDLIQETLRQPRIRTVDLHLNARGEPEYGVLAPIGVPGEPPVGLAYLSWRADQALFRLVASWPVPTESAETFLIRREGDLVRFLTPLRYRPAAALTATQPADAPDLSAPMAARGQRGILGPVRDYRGVPVLAYATPIADSSWLMIAKIDEREAYAGIRNTAWITVLVTGLSLLLIYFAGYLLWRRDRQQRDLTALQARQAAEARFRVVFEQAPLGVALIDSLNGRLIEVNQRFADIAGRTREEMATIDWMQITLPDDVQEELDQMARLNAGEITGFHMNKRYLRPDGALVWISMTIAPVTVVAGEGPRHLCMIEDITERKEAEDRLRSITDAAHDAILMMNPHGAITYWNPAATAILGYSPAEALGADLHRLLAPARYHDVQHAAFHEFMRSGRGGAVGKTVELFARRKDGQEIAVEISLSAVALKDGWNAVGILRDITARRLAEQQLSDSARQFRTVFDNVPIGMFKSTPQGRFVFVNPALATMLGFDSPAAAIEFVNRTSIAAAVYADPSRRLEFMAEVECGSGAWKTFENRYRRRDGSEFTALLNFSVQPDPITSEPFCYGFIQDISERLRQAEALAQAQVQAARHASEQRLLAVIDQGLAGVVEADLEGRLTRVNDRCCAMLGYSREALIGRCWQELRVAEDRASDTQVADDLFQRGQPCVIEQRVRCQGGESRWVTVSVSPINDQAGQPLGAVALMLDITARKQAEADLAQKRDRLQEANMALEAEISERRRMEAQLRDSEDLARQRWNELEAVYATAPVGLCVLDAELRYRRVNGYLAEINGLSVAAHHGRTVREIVPDLADSAEPLLRHLIASGEPLLNLELTGETAARPGIKRYWRENFYPLRDDTGVVIGINGVVEEITEQKQVEENLRDSERRFRSLFEHLPVAYQSLDGAGRWLDANDRTAELLGFDAPQELLGRDFVDFWDPSLRAQFDTYFDTFKTEHRIEGELRLRRRDGSPVTVMIAGHIQRDASGRFQCTHCVLSDISERRAMEEAIRELNADLERKVAARTAEARAASAAKSEFLAHMSHEIRTPLNGVLGLAQVLGRECLTANQRDMVERIQNAGQSLLVILNDVLDLSKIEAGQLRIEPRAFALEPLLARLDNLLGQSARAKGLALRTTVSGAPLGPLVGDGLRLEQVLTNLIGNAIKFTEQGEIRLEVRLLETSETAVRLRFEVADTGIGIAPAALANLFTPFTQAEAGITRRFGGTGLGLSISKRLVELMGGEIGVESRVGEGSTFWCELPFTRTTEGDTAPPPTLPLPPTGPRLTGVRLLVVDDSAMNREVIERALALEGALATPAVDGQQAIQILEAQPAAFDAVLMDVRMPVMDGLTATRLIRAELGLSELPIIACTAGVLSEEQAAARAAGVNGILAKPLDLEQMVTLLRLWVQPRPAAAARDLQHLAVDGVELAAETFPKIPGIDRARTARTLGRDRALFLRLLSGFADEFADAVAATRHDLARGEREAATRRLHTLRGNAGNLGAIDLMESARGLEESLVRGVSASDLEEGLAAFDGQLDAFLAASAPWRSAPAQTPAEPAPAPVPGDAAASPLDPLQLATLREALSHNDAKARRLFRALEPSLRAALGTEIAQAVGQAIGNLRFDTALTVLEQAGAEFPMMQGTGQAGDPGETQ